jgi:hypothetical protein
MDHLWGKISRRLDRLRIKADVQEQRGLTRPPLLCQLKGPVSHDERLMVIMIM